MVRHTTSGKSLGRKGFQLREVFCVNDTTRLCRVKDLGLVGDNGPGKSNGAEAQGLMGLEPIEDLSNMGDPLKVYSLDSWSLSQHE